MGWASGANLADSLWDSVKQYIPKDKQAQVAAEFIDIFEGRDCDTMMETQLWELANKHCPACNQDGSFEGETLDDCPRCEGYGWIKI